MQRNETWSLFPLSTNKKDEGYKWVFKVKSIQMALSTSAKLELWRKVFVKLREFILMEHMVQWKSLQVQIILTIALPKCLVVRELDINNAFLNGDLKKEIFMEKQRGFEIPRAPKLVCNLHKTLYGLR